MTKLSDLGGAWSTIWTDSVKKHYKKCNKYYHTTRHIEDMFEFYKYWRKEFLSCYPYLPELELLFSIAWHDADYYPGDRHNEERAAYEFLKNCSNSEVDKQSVFFAIMSTRESNHSYDNALQQVLHDLDWSVFRSYSSLRKADAKVINEFTERAGYAYMDVRNGRIAFYRRTINDGEIFVTDVCKNYLPLGGIIQMRINVLRDFSKKV